MSSANNNSNTNVADPQIGIDPNGNLSLLNAAKFDPQWNNNWFKKDLLEAISQSWTPLGAEVDLIDDPTFSPTDYINSIFPDGRSLQNVNGIIAKVKTRIEKIDQDTLWEVHNQSRLSTTGSGRLATGRKSILELLTNVNKISNKATQSEAMLTAICSDLRDLDHAKRHLTQDVAVLRKLKQLVEGVEMLRTQVVSRQYSMIANLLEEVLQVSQEFHKFKLIPKVQELTNSISIITGDLKAQAHTEFQSFIRFPNGGNNAKLREVCSVIESLGDDFKKEFMDWFAGLKLQDYNAKFSREGQVLQPNTDDVSSLEFVHLRYEWFDDQLQFFDRTCSTIFPPRWKMDEVITEEFCVSTKIMLQNELLTARDKVNVVSLLKAITRTAEFEKEISKRFPMNEGKKKEEYETGYNLAESEETNENENNENEEEEMEENQQKQRSEDFSLEAIKEKWKKKEQELKARKEQIDKERQIKIAPPRSKWRGLISSCFDPYMDVYIAQENTNLGEMLKSVTKEDGENPWFKEDEAGNFVLDGSTKLILYFGEAIKRCSKLTVNQPLFDLYSLCKNYFKQYAQFLNSKIPVINAIPQPNPVTTPAPITYTEADEKIFCLEINTGEYCANITDSLGRTLKNKIAEKFKESIDLEQEKTEFLNVVNKAVEAVASNIVLKLEKPFKDMIDIAQSDVQVVGDQSKYVGAMKVIIQKSCTQYKEWLNPASHRYFCGVFVGIFANRLYYNLWRPRKYNEASSQQLLLDLMAIKDVFTKLESNEVRVKHFSKLVNREMEKVEGLLKTLASPIENVIQTYIALVPNGNDVDFGKLLDLKNVRFQEKHDLLERYLVATNKRKTDRNVVSEVAANFFGGKNSLTLPQISLANLSLTMQNFNPNSK